MAVNPTGPVCAHWSPAFARQERVYCTTCGNHRRFHTSDKLAMQSEEFDAASEFAVQVRRLEMTPIVDDDYHSVRHGYESTLRSLIEAIRLNGRLK